MKPPSGFPIKRVSFAILISLAGHALLLWQWPAFEFTFNNETLPPLQAKLEPLPKLAKKHIPQQQATEKLPASIAEPTTTFSENSTSESTIHENTVTNDLPAPSVAKETSTAPPLPKHAQLHFAAQYKDSSFKLGEIVHRLDTENGEYTLRAETHTTGLINWLKSYHLTQTSTGKITTQGLQPENYTEAKTDSRGTLINQARFDWLKQKVTFLNKQESELPRLSQDILSFVYQISQIPLNTKFFQISLCNGKKISNYYIMVGAEENIETTLGTLRTIPLKKLHGDNEDGLIIWLALEYRLLPVKIQYLDKSGVISANITITDIRVSDE